MQLLKRYVVIYIYIYIDKLTDAPWCLGTMIEYCTFGVSRQHVHLGYANIKYVRGVHTLGYMYVEYLHGTYTSNTYILGMHTDQIYIYLEYAYTLEVYTIFFAFPMSYVPPTYPRYIYPWYT